MATIAIRSRMGCFRMISAIRRMDSDSIDGISSFKQAPAFAGLEAMAQLAALHVRCRVKFSRHAFLLKVIYCRGLSGKPLDGRHFVHARLESHSQNAFRYAVLVDGAQHDVIAGELLIGVRDYDAHFEKHGLQGYYRKMVDDLLDAAYGPVAKAAGISSRNRTV